MEIVIGFIALTLICFANYLLPTKDIVSNKERYDASFTCALISFILFVVFLVMVEL